MKSEIELAVDVASISFAEPPKSLTALSLFESVSDGILLVNREWQCIYHNQSAADEIGQRRHLIGANLWELFPALAQSKSGWAFKQSMSEGISTYSEDLYPPTGEWYSLDAYPLSEGLAIFFRRITERKQAEQAVTASEQRFRAMFTTLTQGVIFQDTFGKITDANPAAERILGLARAEIIGRTTRDPIWQACDENELPLTAETFSGQIAFTKRMSLSNVVVGIYSPALRERRWLSFDIIPQFSDIDDSRRQVCSIFSDITDQRASGSALRRSQANLALAQRVAGVGSATLNVHSHQWEWSDETYRIHGVDRDVFTPSENSVIELIHPEDRPAYLARLEIAQAGGIPQPLEYRVIRPNGEERIVYSEANFIYDQSQKKVGIISVNRDVTESRITYRQKEHLQKQLYHAQRLDALGTLAGGIAHDLNNTLVPILGLSEAILKGLASDDPTRPLLNIVHTAGIRARDLVRQILAFSRRENSENSFFDLRHVLENSLAMARASLPTSISIRLYISEVTPIYGDASQLHQVILNLIANAAQAIGEQPGSITIEVGLDINYVTRGTEKNRNQPIRVSVSDTGCGMDEETKKRIFEPFFTTKAVGVGTGLGLAVVHGIVAAHGGRIAVETKLGKGTRFDVYLPAHPSKPPEVPFVGEAS